MKTYTINYKSELFAYALKLKTISMQESSVSINPNLFNLGHTYATKIDEIRNMSFKQIEAELATENNNIGFINKTLIKLANYKYNVNIVETKNIKAEHLNTFIKTLSVVCNNLKRLGLTFKKQVNLTINLQDDMSPYCVGNEVTITHLNALYVNLSHELGHAWENQNIRLEDALKMDNVKAIAANGLNNCLDHNVNMFKYSKTNKNNYREKFALTVEFMNYCMLKDNLTTVPDFMKKVDDAEVLLTHVTQLERELKITKKMDNDFCLIMNNMNKSDKLFDLEMKIKNLYNAIEMSNKIEANDKNDLFNKLALDFKNYIDFISKKK